MLIIIYMHMYMMIYRITFMTIFPGRCLEGQISLGHLDTVLGIFDKGIGR
jgi:hypothetical protein